MKVDLIPIFDDNYVFMIHGSENGVIVVDPGDGGPVRAFLEREGLRIEAIFVTHHHDDHVGGVADLLDPWPCPVYAPALDEGEWPFEIKPVAAGDVVTVAGRQFRVMELPGHTDDHVAYYSERQDALFSGDVLFGLGCGRLFEGTPEEMFESLSLLKELPPRTLVYCTHEYTLMNVPFVEREVPAVATNPGFHRYRARAMDLRSRGEPTVPLSLADEMACNPMLLAATADEFREIRRKRDVFKA